MIMAGGARVAVEQRTENFGRLQGLHLQELLLTLLKVGEVGSVSADDREWFSKMLSVSCGGNKRNADEHEQTRDLCFHSPPQIGTESRQRGSVTATNWQKGRKPRAAAAGEPEAERLLKRPGSVGGTLPSGTLYPTRARSGSRC